MAEENKELFRKKSMESIQSPESLNEYLKVTSPGVWILLVAVIVILIGVVVWGILGKIDATSDVAVVSEEDGVYCYMPETVIQNIADIETVKVEGQDYEIQPDTLEPVIVSKESTNIYIMIAGGLKDGDVIYKIPVACTLPEGLYEGTVVTESISPASFLFN